MKNRTSGDACQALSVKKVIALLSVMCHSLCMAKKTLWTQQDLRTELMARLRNRRNVDACAEIGVKPNHLSQVVNGMPINGAILKWLGFEKSESLYRRKEQA